jgi:hypothetical protein
VASNGKSVRFGVKQWRATVVQVLGYYMKNLESTGQIGSAFDELIN